MQDGASKRFREAFPNRVTTKLGTEGGEEKLVEGEAEIRAEVSGKRLGLWSRRGVHTSQNARCSDAPGWEVVPRVPRLKEKS